MQKVIYAMGGVSADGYIVGPDGKYDGRYPTMISTDSQRADTHDRDCWGVACTRRWSTGDGRQGSSGREVVREFALIWQALPKVVFSRTIDSVEGANTTLACDDLRAELSSLQESVGGTWR